MPQASIFYVWFYAMIVAIPTLLGGCNLPAKDVIFLSVADGCYEVGIGLSAAKLWQKRMEAQDLSTVDGIANDAATICKDKNNPPSTTQIASDGLRLAIARINAIVAKYAAKFGTTSCLEPCSPSQLALKEWQRLHSLPRPASKALSSFLISPSQG